MRLWFLKEGYSGKGKPPSMPKELIVKITQKYMQVYEDLTGDKFEIDTTKPQLERIIDNVSKLV